jgi:polysaccharide export outer membrane protein
MAFVFRNKRLMALGIAILLFNSCGPVSQTPEMAAKRVSETGTSSSTSSITEINRNIASASIIGGGSALSSDYKIGPEDFLEITLFNIPEADGKITPRTVQVRVTQEGFVSLPVIGAINTKGLTTTDLEKKLRELYDKYIYNPQVGVLVREFRQRVSVIGAVQKPGVVELTGPKTVTDMLAMAGGINEKAGSQVHIYRQTANGRETHVIDLAVLADSAALSNPENMKLITMPVEPGDVINVPSVGNFFVDGAVRKPGPYPLGRHYTLTQALVTAGGVDPELNSSEITIFRRKAGARGMESIPIDYSAVLSGSSNDPQIEPDDVIIVPMSTVKYLVKRFVGSLLDGISIGSIAAGT